MIAAPPDAEADAAYERIAKIARDHALIVEGYGGHMTIATPAAQREAGLREKVLRMHLMEEQ